MTIKILKSEKIMRGAAGYLWRELRRRLGGGKKVLLLLSGGSAIEVYRILVEWLKKENKGFAKNLTVGLVDERWGSVGHPDSNEEQIRQTGFYEAVKEKGGKTLSVLTDRAWPCQLVADRYNKFVRQYIEDTDEVLAIMGVGPDGHTAGILPQKSQEEFEKVFPANRWVVYYELPQDYSNPFKKRITLTPRALSKINLAVVVAKSEGKEEALRKMFSANEPLYRTPAVLLPKLNGALFTDKNIS